MSTTAGTGRYRIGCDIGGTFTDFILYDERSRSIVQEKVLTTPHDPAEGVVHGCRLLIERESTIVDNTKHVIHGTTLVINAVLERTGARTGLLTTAGFRDVLEMRRYMRADMYDVFGDLPEPLVSRDRRVEIPERIYADGSIVSALDQEAASRAVSSLLDLGVASIAVTLLHSYVNSEHEREIERIIRELDSTVAISLSSEVLPQISEFERTSATVVNAYVKPIVERYLERLVDQIARLGLTDNLFLMLSGGGVTSVDTAKRFPVRLVESGPVAGVLAADFFGRLSDARDVLSFDMGGTTAKAALIQAGQIPITSEYEVARVHRYKKGSGIPLALPAVDIIEVGTGGGSIAYIDELGFVKVGPRSAGAAPGPACYGQGGTEPTVTDADLVLGYLDPDYFLGGRMKLDRDAAERAIGERIAGPLSVSITDAAWGVIDIAREHMANAIKMHIAERGGDPAGTTIVASGGAGPLHAFGLLRKLRAAKLVLPPNAGVMSALGMLMAPVSFDLIRTRKAELSTVDPAELETTFYELERDGRAVLAQADPVGRPSLLRSLDLRYAGQGYELTIPVEGPLDREVLVETFHQAYRERYGYAASDTEIEVVSMRVRAFIEGSEPVIPRLDGARVPIEQTVKGSREAFDPDAHAYVPHTVFDRYRLAPGMAFSGPVIIEERESTVIVGRSGRVEVDAYGSLVVTLEDDRAGRSQGQV